MDKIEQLVAAWLAGEDVGFALRDAALELGYTKDSILYEGEWQYWQGQPNHYAPGWTFGKKIRGIQRNSYAAVWYEGARVLWKLSAETGYKVVEKTSEGIEAAEKELAERFLKDIRKWVEK